MCGTLEASIHVEASDSIIVMLFKARQLDLNGGLTSQDVAGQTYNGAGAGKLEA